MDVGNARQAISSYDYYDVRHVTWANIVRFYVDKAQAALGTKRNGTKFV